MRVRWRGVVADRLDGCDETIRLDDIRVVADGRGLCCEVDRRLDAVELVQSALYPRRAGRAGHAFERECCLLALGYLRLGDGCHRALRGYLVAGLVDRLDDRLLVERLRFDAYGLRVDVDLDGRDASDVSDLTGDRGGAVAAGDVRNAKGGGAHHFSSSSNLCVVYHHTPTGYHYIRIGRDLSSLDPEVENLSAVLAQVAVGSGDVDQPLTVARAGGADA